MRIAAKCNVLIIINVIIQLYLSQPIVSNSFLLQLPFLYASYVAGHLVCGIRLCTTTKTKKQKTINIGMNFERNESM